MSHAYRLSALKLVSDIELPELMAWHGWHDAPADLVFRLGKVPSRLDAPDHVAIEFQTKGRRQYLTTFPEEARVLVENGCAVTVEPAPGTDLTDARSILMAPVQAVLWHQRGLLPLHASVVGVGGRAVALAGPSGAGKSTLAAVLALQGHDVLADDICIIDAAFGADVLPGTRRLRLWRDALDHLGIAVDGLPRALSRREKYLIEGGEWEEPERQKLAAIVLLSRHAGDAVTIERLRGARSIIELQGVVHMPEAARALGLDPAIFTALTKLASLGVTVWQLAMPDDRGCLDDAAARVLAVLRDG
jgi:hypothetical protein